MLPLADALKTHLERRSPRALAAWLLRGFAERDWSPVRLAADPTTAIQLQRAYDGLKELTRDRFRSAVTMAVSQWRRKAHGPSTLADLATVAALIRASQTVPFLRTIITNRELSPADPPQ